MTATLDTAPRGDAARLPTRRKTSLNITAALDAKLVQMVSPATNCHSAAGCAHTARPGSRAMAYTDPSQPTPPQPCAARRNRVLIPSTEGGFVLFSPFNAAPTTPIQNTVYTGTPQTREPVSTASVSTSTIDSQATFNPYGIPVWQEDGARAVQNSGERLSNRHLRQAVTGVVFAAAALTMALLGKPTPAEAAYRPGESICPERTPSSWIYRAKQLLAHAAGTGFGGYEHGATETPTVPPTPTRTPTKTPLVTPSPTPRPDATPTPAQIAQVELEKKFPPNVLARLRAINANNKSPLQPQELTNDDKKYLLKNYPNLKDAFKPWKLETFREDSTKDPKLGVLTNTEGGRVALHTALGVFIGNVPKSSAEVEKGAIDYAANHGGIANPGDMVIFIGHGSETGAHDRKGNPYIVVQWGTDLHGSRVSATKLRVGMVDPDGNLIFRAVQVNTPKGLTTSVDAWTPDQLAKLFGLCPGAMVQLRGDPNIRGEMTASMVSVILDAQRLRVLRDMESNSQIKFIN